MTEQEKALKEIRATMQTAGWAHLRRMLDDLKMKNLSLLAAPTRPEGLSDDFLRGRVDMVNFVLEGITRRLAAIEAERLAEAQAPRPVEAIGSPYDPAANPPEEN